MLEETTSFLGTLAQRGIDQALPDNRIALSKGCCKEGDIFQPHTSPIDEVLVLATTIRPPRHGHFGELAGQPTILVIEGDGNLRQTSRGLALAASEDHVLRLLRAQGVVACLSQDPADGIGDIGLARPIRSDHGSNARFEHEARFLGKAFEPMQIKPGEPWFLGSGRSQSIGQRFDPG